MTQTHPAFSTEYRFYSDINPENSATYHDGATNRYVFGVETGTYAVRYWNLGGDPGTLPFPVTAADAMTTVPLVSFTAAADTSPYAGINGDNWVASYQRTFTADTGWYEFSGSADDGIRVLIDGALIPLNNAAGEGGWRGQSFGTPYVAKQYLTAGSHTIEVQYYQGGGGEQLEFRFYPIEAISPVAVISRPILSQLNSLITSPFIGVDVTSAMSYAISGSCSGTGTVARGVTNVSLTFVGDPVGAHSDCQIEFTDAFGAHATVSIPAFTVTTSPVQVASTCAELQTIGQNPNTYLDTISLSSGDHQIDCTGVSFTPLRFGGERSFQGIFEGNDHRITGLEIVGFSAGLIESIDRGTVRNLTLGTGQVNGFASAGGVAGYATNAVLTNIHSELTISSAGSAGGIVAGAEMSNAPGEPITWSGLSVSSSIAGIEGVGGLIGNLATYGDGASFTLSSSTYNGSLGEMGNMSSVGGMVGYMVNAVGGEATSSLVLNNLSASTTLSCNDGYRCGGLVGYFQTGYGGGVTDTLVQNSSSTGRIIAHWGSAGGLFGAVNLYEGDQTFF